MVLALAGKFLELPLPFQCRDGTGQAYRCEVGTFLLFQCSKCKYCRHGPLPEHVSGIHLYCVFVSAFQQALHTYSLLP